VQLPNAACAVALRIVYSCQLQHVPFPSGLCAIANCSDTRMKTNSIHVAHVSATSSVVVVVVSTVVALGGGG
jgi:hypothetical protein